MTLLYATNLSAQKITLNYNQEPLNEVLLELNQKYQVQISISSNLSSECLITTQKSFDSLQEALQFLAQKCGLKLTQISNVYTFSKAPSTPPPKPPISKKRTPPTYLFQGVILEASTGEPLPYTLISLNKGNLISDENGRFSFKSSQISEQVQFRHLSYEIADTTLQPGNTIKIQLRSSPELLEEILISSPLEVADIHLGQEVGHIKFNDINNNLVPGESTNLIFNNLRLYPGITAAGESNADYVIWGSHAGQNHIIFDGITLFNSWGINTDLGRVNPFFIKNVEVFKGAYNVPYGDRIGGVVLIEGKSGNIQKPAIALSLSNQIASGYLNIPLFNHSTNLQLGLRKSYYQTLNLESSQNETDNFIEPTYDYGDFNIKLSSDLSQKDHLEINLITSQDDYQGNLNINRRRVSENIQINSFQLGSSLQYSHQWNKGGISSIQVSQSFYRPELSSNFTFAGQPIDSSRFLSSFSWQNEIQENQAQLKHIWSKNPKHQWEFSTGIVHNQAKQFSLGEERILDDQTFSLSRWKAYLMDQFQVSSWLRLQLGLKVEMPFKDFQLFAQPRLNGNIQMHKYWSLQFGWGLYNQFISKNTVVDQLGNRTDIWQISYSQNAPVLESMHQVIGLSYLRDKFEFNVEAYYRLSEGHTRSILNRAPRAILLKGESRALGLDFYIKKEFQGHELVLAYSLAEVNEKYTHRAFTTGFNQAPHSQNHEFKTTLILNFLPFKFSFTQVYGSGFPNSPNTQRTRDTQDYWRVDFATQYQFKVRKIAVETGFSVLNLFNRQNIRLNQSLSTPTNPLINTLGVPFSPSFYLNVYW